MDIFNVLNLVGGLSLFLFGMTIMGQALEKTAGNNLQKVLGKITDRKFIGLFTGLSVTAVIQSSSATTVMVVGFVNSGIMTLKQSINVIMGANIGTTVTAWILSLAGVQSDNIVVKLFKPSSFTPLLALIGVILLLFNKREKRKDYGTILLGFATLMVGMETMSASVSGLKNIPEFQQLFIRFSNPVLGVLAGAVLTAIIQSSSASVGILQALATTGSVTYGSAIPIIMGQNIGTCITALISSVGANKNAKRAAAVHLSFNVIGTVIWLTVFCIIKKLIMPSFLNNSASLLGIAIVHSIFNVLCTVVMLPLGSSLEKFVVRLIPDNSETYQEVELDERLLSTPAIALEQCRLLLCDMAACSLESLNSSVSLIKEYDIEISNSVNKLEDKTDYYEGIIGAYLVKLSSFSLTVKDSMLAAAYLKMIGDFERIADHCVNIKESAMEMYEKGINFSSEAEEEMSRIAAQVQTVTEKAYTALVQNDLSIATEIEPLEETIDELRGQLRTNHIERLQQGECDINTGFVWSDLLTDLERISDHCLNISDYLVELSESN